MAGDFVLDGCAVVTVDAANTEYETGHVVVSGGTIAAVGAGPAPAQLVDSLPGVSRVDASGCYHDRSPGAMLRVAVSPCSPFSCSTRLVADAADLARRVGVRLHTLVGGTR